MEASVTVRVSALTIPKAEEPKAVNASTEIPDSSDEALMDQAKNGGTEALPVLFHRYARLVRAIAYKILRDESEADDALQEVFLFLHRKSVLFDSSKNSARSWIVQVTYHRAIDRRRYLQSRHFYTQVDLEDVESDLGAITDKPVTGGLEKKEIRKLFDALSENQRQTLQLFFFEGLSLEEIALKLGQTRGNVKNHYFRGLDKLRKQLLTAEAGAIKRHVSNVVHSEGRFRPADEPPDKRDPDDLRRGVKGQSKTGYKETGRFP
jgi:RNA polymerase sigma-70 factor, ECF subfamily